MEVKVIEESDNKLVFELAGSGHGFCNVLKHELWKNSHVKVATYTVDHPLVGSPRFIVETDGSVKPRKVLADAAKKLGSQFDEFKKTFKKAIK